MEEIRLNKYISEAGVCSRREADRLIEAGRVLVDGVRATQGMKVREGQKVQVGDRVIGGKDEKVVLAVYKPVGHLCGAPGQGLGRAPSHDQRRGSDQPDHAGQEPP